MTLLFTLTTLMVFHGLFVAAEYAIVKTAGSNDSTKRRSTRSHQYLTIFEHLELYLMVCQLAKTIALLAMGVLLGLLLSHMSAGHTMAPSELDWKQIGALGLGFSATVVLQLIIGFEIPRTIGISRSDSCTENLSSHLIVSRWILWPILTIVYRFKQLLV